MLGGVPDIIMAVVMVVLLLCVLELCLGVEVCGGVFCSPHSRERDAERRDGASDPPTPQHSESPPSYEAIMSTGGAGAPTGEAAAEGLERERDRETLPLKRAFSFHFKLPTPDDGRLPPVRPPSSQGVSETSFTSLAELCLAVDGLPTYEEAMARLEEREQEEEAVEAVQGEAGTVTQGAGATQQNTSDQIPGDENAGQQVEQASVGLQEEGTR